ncbi:non-ribosomal peptide synthetase [Bacillus cereus group sp. BfR-BA-01380]|uniref:non-ribosomal peptide synthetase n=1 Tax=Bacillus cereus group sp. BfR-BA-01380 TaxID=2920324 RepID=UPI001F595C10|nr:non-ribosomal peptide synthetase [Bacillus cereus group sp. BfR-BA-01380]
MKEMQRNAKAIDEMNVTVGQDSLWLANQMELKEGIYNEPVIIHLKGRLNIEFLKLALSNIIESHHALRAVFIKNDSTVKQVIKRKIEFDMPVHDLTQFHEAEKESILTKYLEHTIYKHFDLEDGPLFRTQLIKLDSNEYIFQIVFHHIIFDGCSLGIFIQQLSDNYTELASNQQIINQESIYKKIIEYENNKMYSTSYNEAHLYWEKFFDCELPYTKFPADFNENRMDSEKGSGECISKILDKDVFVKIKDFAQKNQVSVYRVMLSTYFSLLHQMTNEEEMVVGMPINTRPKFLKENVFGYFVNSLPIFVSVSKNDTFQELLKKVDMRVNEAIKYQNYPFSHFIQNVKSMYNSNLDFTYSTAFNMINLPELHLPGIETKVMTDSKRVTVFDMVWRIVRYTENDECKIEIDYNTNLYKPETIHNLIERFERLLQKFILNANKPIHSLDLLLDKDYALYRNINSQIQEYPGSKTLDELIDIQAMKSPNQVAISMGNQQITYRELKQRSDQIANYLCENNVKKGQRVTIMMEREIDTIVSIISVLKSGGVYVPITPEFPESRIQYILNDSESQIVITRKKYREFILKCDIKMLCIDELEYFTSYEPFERQHTSADIAYIIYTSGSTGLPKGVAVPHKGVVNLSYSLKNNFSLTNKEIFLQFASIIFDASIIEIFPILLSGGEVYIISEIQKRSVEDFIKVIQTKHVNYCILPTVFFKLLVTMPKDMLCNLHSLKCIFVGGETLPAESVRNWQEKMGLKIPIINAYGPTEATVCTTMHEIKEEILDEQSIIPIGRPIHNSEVFIVSPSGTLCPPNVIGELYIGGEGVAKGYINQEEKTKAAFITSDLLKNSNKVFYCSGDLARLLPNGNVEFLGRKDNQVKLRGYRIELGEIEEVLLQHPKVEDTVSFVYKNDKMVSFYVSKDNKVIKDDELKEFLNTKLPDFMIPNYLFQCETFPLSPSGKIDRKKLEMQITSLLEKKADQYMPPTSNTEKKLAGVWAYVLKLEKQMISKDEDFFGLGGHSLIAVQVLNQIQRVFHVKLEIKDIFKYRTISRLSAYIEKLSDQQNENTKIDINISKIKDKQYYQLSNAQKRMWFLHKLNPIDRVYDIPIHLYIKPGLQKNVLQASLELLIQRHEMLRTIFVEKNGEPQQIILKTIPIHFHYEDVFLTTKEEEQIYINKRIQEMDCLPFDLEKGPLFRVQLFNIDNEASYLYINLHHIISDEWSLKYLLDELMTVYQTLYKGEIPNLSSIHNRYVDYCAWQQMKLDTGEWDKEKKYWISEMDGSLPVLNLPTDFHHSSKKKNKGGVFRLQVDKKVHHSLKQVCEQENVSMYMLFFATYIQLLHYLTDQKDIIVGTPVSGRDHEAFEHIQGLFVNTLAIRTQLYDVKNLQQLLQIVKKKCLDAFQNQSYPFDKVIESINPDRSVNSNPIFTTMFSYQKEMLQSNDEYSLQFLASKQEFSKFDLSMSIEECEHHVDVVFEYHMDLFKKGSIARFAQNFLTILQGFIKQRTVSYEKLNFLSNREKQLFTKVNNTEKSYPYFKNIQEQFCKQVELYPKQIALSTEHSSLTYEQLNNYSDQVAHYLWEKGVKRGDKVAIFLDRSVDSIVAMIGILKAGGAYISIDVKYPKERIEYILTDSEACRIITNHEYKKHLNSDAINIFTMEEIQQTDVNGEINIINEPDDLAYIIYTSGSTGKPKGTLLTHKGVLNLAQWRKEVFDVSNVDKVTQFYSHSFDSSVSEIFSTLLNGAQLYLLSNEQRYSTGAYIQAIQEMQVTISDVPTVFFNELSTSLIPTDFEKIKSLRMIIMGGEAASATAIKNWQSMFQNRIQIVNEYGPTESTVTAMFYPITTCVNDDFKNVPIGMPISNTKVYILNSYMQPCPIGVIGELYIDSMGLAKGYWNLEDKTKCSFIPNPFSGDTKHKLYRTGDLAKWLPNGNIEFMGRRDKQVKIRGHRIELGEIEDAILQFPRIKQAVVIPSKDGMLLQAYYKTVDDQTVSNQDLSSHLSSVLPEYMLPRNYTHVLEIPVTTNGKVDFRKLLEIKDEHNSREESIIELKTTVQKNIARVWSEVLNIKSIGLKDNFFHLGGHSLKIMPVLVQLKSLYPNLKIQDFFQYRTIEKLSHHIENISDLETKEERVPNRSYCEKDSNKNDDIPNLSSMSYKGLIKYPKVVLLTGATGYLGAHILKQLLDLPSTVIYCLVRNNDKQELGGKLEERMEFYFGTEILSKMKGRIILLKGDLSLINLGLSSQIINTLKNDLDTIIHCGGDVRHYGEREHFQKVNVQSTKYLLRLAKKADARFHYISTLSVVGHAENDPNEFLFFESDFDRGQILDNVYLESKFQAEKIVREAIKKGIRATIYRVGNLVGDSVTGQFQYNINENAFYRLLKGIFLSKAAPKVHTYIDLTPVDYCSSAITQLSYMDNTIGQTMHICNPVQLNWEQFINNLKGFGYDIRLLDEQEYIDKFFATHLSSQNQQALELIMPLLEAVEEGTVSIPSCKNTQRYLDHVGISCLEPSQEYINLLLEYAIGIGFFPTIKEPIML